MNVSTKLDLTLELVTCCRCGEVFGVSASLDQNRRRTGDLFTCTNGHQQGYGRGENAKLKDQIAHREKAIAAQRQQLDQEKAANRDLREQRDKVERRLTAQKAATTRLKNVVAKGKCPCCEQLFPDLENHMKESHPDYEQQEEPGTGGETT